MAYFLYKKLTAMTEATIGNIMLSITSCEGSSPYSMLPAPPGTAARWTQALLISLSQSLKLGKVNKAAEKCCSQAWIPDILSPNRCSFPHTLKVIVVVPSSVYA